MIFSILFDVYNLDDKIQVSISKQTMVGDRIVREAGEGRTTDIAGNALHTPHPTHDFLVKTDNNYFLLDGSVKVRYEWVDGDKFTDEHKETYRSVVVNSDEHARANTTFNDGVGFMEGHSCLGNNAMRLERLTCEIRTRLFCCFYRNHGARHENVMSYATRSRLGF